MAPFTPRQGYTKRVTIRDALILIGSLVVVGAIGLYGVRWNTERQINTFIAGAGTHISSARSFADLAAFYDSAPAMVCTREESGFNGASRLVLYHAGTQTRMDSTNLTTGDTMSEIFDETGYYIWTNKSETVRFLSRDRYSDPDVKSLFAATQASEDVSTKLFSSSSCKPWKMNAAAFELPTKLISQVIISS